MLNASGENENLYNFIPDFSEKIYLFCKISFGWLWRTNIYISLDTYRSICTYAFLPTNATYSQCINSPFSDLLKMEDFQYL